MPALIAEDVSTWGKSRVEKEMRERLEDIQSIRQKNDGSLANVIGDEADRVRQHNGDLQILGDRKEAIVELTTADDHARQLEEQLNTPAGKMRHAGGEPREEKQIDPRDAGTIFATSDALKSFRENGIKGIEASVPIGALLPEYRELDLKGFRPAVGGRKDLLGESGGTATTYPVQSIRVGVMVDQLFQVPNIADLMPQTTINQPAVPFMRETVNSQGAVETAEGALAPEASISFAEDSAPVRKIPVMIPATEEILADEMLVQGHINARLPLFIRQREDAQLLNGDATGQNLQGILHLSGIDTTSSYSIGTPVLSKGQDALEAVFNATIRIAESFLMADAAVMGLGLWEEIRLAKDKQNNYLIAPATDVATPRIWGLRVVTNQNMPVESTNNKPILVGAFAQASQIWRRQAITLAVSDSHVDNFGKGILVIKATSRVAVTHYRAAGYATVTSAA